MITKNDWNDALDAWVEEERERLGGPATPEEVVAYLSGELSGAASERIRALMVYYPELTPLLDEKIEKTRKPHTWIVPVYAMVTTLAVAALVYTRDSPEPTVLSSHHELSAVRARGSATTFDLPAGEKEYLITAVPSTPPSEDAYEIEIARASNILWSAQRVRPLDDTFVIAIPGKFLKPGTYTLTIRSEGRLVDGYTLRVTTPR